MNRRKCPEHQRAGNAAGSRTRGVVYSLSSAFLWSTTFLIGRYLVGGGQVDPVTLSLLRFALGGILLFLVGVIIQRRGFFAISRTDYARLAALGFTGILGMSVLLFWGQQTTTATVSSMLVQLSPLFVIFLGPLVREKITRWKLGACMVALLGTLLVLGIVSRQGISNDTGNMRGNVLVIGAALCWAIYSVAGKPVVERVGGFRATTWAMLLGAVEILVLRLALPEPPIWPSGTVAWALVLYLAIFPTAVAFYLWYEALNHVSLATMNVIQYLTPVATILLAWPLLGETLSPEKWLGVGVVLAGVALLGATKTKLPGTSRVVGASIRTSSGH